MRTLLRYRHDGQTDRHIDSFSALYSREEDTNTYFIRAYQIKSLPLQAENI